MFRLISNNTRILSSAPLEGTALWRFAHITLILQTFCSLKCQ